MLGAMKIQDSSTARGTKMVGADAIIMSFVTLTKRAVTAMALRQGGTAEPLYYTSSL